MPGSLDEWNREGADAGARSGTAALDLMAGQDDRPTGGRLVLVGAISLAYEGLPPDLVHRREAQLRALQAALEQSVGREVHYLGTAADISAAARLGAEVAALEPEAVIVGCLSAIRSDLGMALLEASTAPVVVWALRDHMTYSDTYRAIDAVSGSGPVGAYALGNVLARRGRPFRMAIDGRPDPDVVAWLRAVGVASSLRRARLGLIGGPWLGMADVQLDVDRLAADLGARWFDVDLADPATLDPFDPADLPVGAGANATFDAVDEPACGGSARLATAMLRAAEGYDALAVRCHSDAVGGHSGYGVMACLGATLATTAGIPVTCTGDKVTAVAMLIAELLGAAAFYVEVDGPDGDRDALLLSNGGEIDLRLARPESTALVEQQFFSGRLGRGLAFSGSVAPGPATLVAFTETEQAWRLISLEVDVLDDRIEGFQVPHAFVRPRASDAGDTYRRLGEAGAPHHAALTRGYHATVIEQLATLIPVEHVAL